MLGIRLVTTPMFKNTCTASRVMIPTMVRAPNLSRALRASQYPRRISRGEQDQHHQPAHKSPAPPPRWGNTKSFSGSGYTASFGRFPQSPAQHPAGADGNEGLHGLIAQTLPLAPGIQPQVDAVGHIGVMVMTIHSRLPTPVIPATNQPQWIPAAKQHRGAPASTRMVPDMGLLQHQGRDQQQDGAVGYQLQKLTRSRRLSIRPVKVRLV